ncbi:hypothetical protein AC578_9773 [Pseudocercospora eumusae]|uniref:PABS domain-containing protein n=1 Tax=Pseudocercospora eumusae TaxID=321146 RepID=A0A139H525_9PEZI|nr:hypothetical protein AC578_9773 [Pseudocercospora eumusae]
MARGNDKSKTTRTKQHGGRGTTAPKQAQPSDNSGLSLALQQKCLDVFRNALKPQEQPTAVVQEVKGHLYNRDFATAFGTAEYLSVYAARWSPSRALGYMQILSDISKDLFPEQESATAEEGKDFRICCVGGGAGAEVVAIAGWISQQADALPFHRVDSTFVDIAAWGSVVSDLFRASTTPPELSKYASAAAREANSALLEQGLYKIGFQQSDALAIEDEECHELFGKADMVTLMFTLNELYTTSIPKTQKLLARLTAELQAGSYLLVVDSPGSYSAVSVNGAEKKYPMQWLLDYTLVGTGQKRKDDGLAKWQKLTSAGSAISDRAREHAVPDTSVQKTGRYWLNEFRPVSRKGLDNAGILDVTTAIMPGPSHARPATGIALKQSWRFMYEIRFCLVINPICGGVQDEAGDPCKLKAEVGCAVKQFSKATVCMQACRQHVAKLLHLRHARLTSLPYKHQHQLCHHHFAAIRTMAEITHPTIKDGWFREINDMWPGQAMTLKVNQVVHHEKSKYQDVLIFESSDYGMVLVLDNVIQCTERDEFSYQEMITHLGMFSHPKPKKVLVIGGGDGGVLREVVKHESVEEAVLCDIDEAVIRLSKKYLPGMSVGFQHPKVKVHVGDGFKFLADYKDSFDVIITDSSDPDGPAEALFQKPYFQLLHDALREGGVITTQGSENPWLHLSMIVDLKKSCKQVFPVAEYGWTTIPTYPSGQIGFMVCTKDGSRDVKKPLRCVSEEEEEKLFKYYSSKVHEAAFVLPKFAEKALR